MGDGAGHIGGAGYGVQDCKGIVGFTMALEMRVLLEAWTAVRQIVQGEGSLEWWGLVRFRRSRGFSRMWQATDGKGAA